jgi:Domain of unknown function (DUF4439)
MSPGTSSRRAFLRLSGSTVLAATGLPFVIAACDADGDEPADAVASTTEPTESGDEEIVAAALRDATRLAASYAAALDRHPDLEGLLADLLADVEEHVDVLTGATDDSDGETRADSTVPRSARDARRWLADLEKQAIRRRRTDSVAAESGDLARLLASMAACHSQHVRVLAPGDGLRSRSPAPDPAADYDESGPLVNTINDTLAGEHAAIYAYGVVGGRLDYDSAPALEATEAWDAHRRRRTGLTAIVEAAGADPAVAAAGYRLPRPIGNVADARVVAQRVEDRCAVLYATLVGTASGDLRAYAVDALIDAAVRGLDWGAPTSPLPGVTTSSS